MAFGHWMDVAEGDVRVRLGPIRREEAVRYIAPDAGFGLQSYEVSRNLGRMTPPTEQGELDWWDKASTDVDMVHWGIRVPVDGQTDSADDGTGWKLIGTTSLMHVTGPGRQAESGFVLFDRAWWGRRIASTAHLGRTLYAFDVLDRLAVTSQAFTSNTGSNKALVAIGYVLTGIGYSDGFIDGQPVDANRYLLPNPAEEAWRYFWRRPDREIPATFHQARTVTQAALARAATAVTFL